MTSQTRVASLCLVSVLLIALPTQADTTRKDAPVDGIFHQLREAGVRADLRTQLQVNASHGRHVLAMMAVRLPLTSRVMLRAGAGGAHVLCEPSQHGSAVAAGARLSVIEGAGVSLGVELSALRVRYSDSGLDDARVMFSIASLDR